MMFELVKSYEIAKSENNTILRFVFVNYTKWRLKHIFFKKFNIYDIKFDKNIMYDFFQLYNFIDENDKDFLKQNFKVPYIISATSEIGMFDIKYYEFEIKIRIDSFNLFHIVIANKYENNSILDFYADDYVLNNGTKNKIKEIIFMAIYNYCVSYIYGEKSKLYIDDASYITYLKNLYI